MQTTVKQTPKRVGGWFLSTAWLGYFRRKLEVAVASFQFFHTRSYKPFAARTLLPERAI